MRILHVIDRFDPATGGPPEAVRQLIRAAGARVEAVCLDNPQAEFLGGIGCPVHALDQSHLGQFAFSPRLGRWLDRNAGRFDGLVMHGLWSYPGLAVRRAARRAARPYGVFAHGALDPWFNRQYPRKRLKKQIYWPLQYAVLRDAAAVFFATGTERDLAKTSFQPNRWTSVVAPLGLVEEQDGALDPAGEVEAFYRAWPALRDRRFLLFLARLHEKKGCDLLVEAFARVAPLTPQLDLVLAGPDQAGLQAKLERRAAELGVAGRVHWPGMIGGAVKWGALRACEALVLPSHQENFGVSVVEALAAGRPVLVSRQVNLWPEIANDGVGLAEEDTLAGVERLLARWCAMPADERAAMAARARPCFEARFSLAKTIAVIETALAHR